LSIVKSFKNPGSIQQTAALALPVISSFITLKYSYLFLSILIGYRYLPLRKFLQCFEGRRVKWKNRIFGGALSKYQKQERKICVNTGNRGSVARPVDFFVRLLFYGTGTGSL
jgi:hypothetical protein